MQSDADKTEYRTVINQEHGSNWQSFQILGLVVVIVIITMSHQNRRYCLQKN
jgi:hypothetical protein